MRRNWETAEDFAQRAALEILFDAIERYDADSQRFQRRLTQHEHAVGSKPALHFYRHLAIARTETLDPVARI